MAKLFLWAMNDRTLLSLTKSPVRLGQSSDTGAENSTGSEVERLKESHFLSALRTGKTFPATRSSAAEADDQIAVMSCLLPSYAIEAKCVTTRTQDY